MSRDLRDCFALACSRLSDRLHQTNVRESGREASRRRALRMRSRAPVSPDPRLEEMSRRGDSRDALCLALQRVPPDG